jgi:hypothetical protein
MLFGADPAAGETGDEVLLHAAAAAATTPTSAAFTTPRRGALRIFIDDLHAICYCK